MTRFAPRKSSSEAVLDKSDGVSPRRSRATGKLTREEECRELATLLPSREHQLEGEGRRTSTVSPMPHWQIRSGDHESLQLTRGRSESPRGVGLFESSKGNSIATALLLAFTFAGTGLGASHLTDCEGCEAFR